MEKGAIWLPPHNSNAPVLLCFHGSAGSARDFEGLDEVLGIEGAGFLYLNGPEGYYGGYRWCDHPTPGSAAYRVVEEALDALSSEGVGSERCFLLGFSQGGALAVEFYGRYPNPLGGALCTSGRLDDLPAFLAQVRPERKTRGHWCFTHGRQDDKLAVETTAQQVERLRQEGFRVDYQEFDKGHTLDCQEEFRFLGQWIADHS